MRPFSCCCIFFAELRVTTRGGHQNLEARGELLERVPKISPLRKLNVGLSGYNHIACIPAWRMLNSFH